MKQQSFLLFALMALTLHVSAQTPLYNTLGVGIATPLGTLHVHTTEGFYYDQPARDLVYPYDYYQTLFHITNTLTGTTLTDGFVIDQKDYTITLRQYEEASFHLKGYNGEGLSILPNGFVGVGTPQPDVRLHVDGNIKASHLTTNGYVSFCTAGQPLSIGVAHSEALNYGSTYIGFNAQRSGSTWTRRNNTWLNGGAVIWATMNGDILFANLPSTGGSDVTNISDDEIMSSVNMMLSSEGVLFAKEVKVTLEDWPDYVFGKDFRIMSLAETEEYIKSNGHLPGVPSASEIEEDGLSLGEMNRLLMQKVEELTLHIIEPQKQVDELKANKEGE